MISDEHEAGCIPDGLILNVMVPGRAAPKGSLDFVKATGRALDNNPRTRPWARAVEAACRRMVAVQPSRPGRWVYEDGYPFAGPVSVETYFHFARPAGSRFTVPATTGTGDLDKLVRNILDALTAARVYVDDALVVDLLASARYCEPGGEGVRIRVRAWDCDEGA